MWRVMGNCALAILAGGLTTAEAVYAGLPTINLFEKEEHKTIMSDLIKKGVCLDGGVFEKKSLKNTVKQVENLYKNRKLLYKIRGLSNNIFDNKGVFQILNDLNTLFYEFNLKTKNLMIQ